ncbi:hypothetical protein GCM10019016_111520 [Streptomyces prasinosporus]|uniref:Uncharacterized protein n=1 Tax=Streptomyces prasinosporus TaxID=68256 RepID=A0ABP6UAT5_9ACTN
MADLEKQDAVPAQAGARPEIRAKGLDAPQRRNLHFSAPTVDGEGGTIEGDFATDEEPVRSSRRTASPAPSAASRRGAGVAARSERAAQRRRCRHCRPGPGT